MMNKQNTLEVANSGQSGVGQENALVFGHESMHVPAISRRGSVAKGCLIATVIFLVIAIGIGVWVAMNWKSWTASGMKAVTKEIVASSVMPEEEKTRVIARVDAVADDFKAGKISLVQLGSVMKAFGESTIVPLGTLLNADKKYISASTLSDADKADARLTMQRYMRGLVEKTLTVQDFDTAAALITATDANGKTTPKATLTDAELTAFVAKLKAKADEAKISVEPYKFDFATQIDKVITEALAKPV